MTKPNKEILSKLPEITTNLVMLQYAVSKLLLELHRDAHEMGHGYPDDVVEAYDTLLDLFDAFETAFAPLFDEYLERVDALFGED